MSVLLFLVSSLGLILFSLVVVCLLVASMTLIIGSLFNALLVTVRLFELDSHEGFSIDLRTRARSV